MAVVCAWGLWFVSPIFLGGKNSKAEMVCSNEPPEASREKEVEALSSTDVDPCSALPDYYMYFVVYISD